MEKIDKADFCNKHNTGKTDFITKHDCVDGNTSEPVCLLCKDEEAEQIVKEVMRTMGAALPV